MRSWIFGQSAFGQLVMVTKPIGYFQPYFFVKYKKAFGQCKIREICQRPNVDTMTLHELSSKKHALESENRSKTGPVQFCVAVVKAFGCLAKRSQLVPNIVIEMPNWKLSSFYHLMKYILMNSVLVLSRYLFVLIISR